MDELRRQAVSVVVPVKNEAENVLPLIGEIRAALDGHTDYEIIFVDDGSDDDTPQRLREAKLAVPRLRVIRLRECCGQSTAILTGVRRACFGWVVTLDGDGQNDPADIPRLFAAATPGVELVCGHRRRRRDTPFKRLQSRIANGVCSRVLGDGTPDTGCGLKLFRRDVFLSLPYFDHMHRFLPALFRRHGGQVVSVEVNHRPRMRGRSKYGMLDRLWAGIVDMMGVMWLQRRAKIPIVLKEE